MKSLVFAAVVIASACCFAQRPKCADFVCNETQATFAAKALKCPSGTIQSTNGDSAGYWRAECIPSKNIAQPAPLKCGKYQYVKTDDYVYVSDCRPTTSGKLECSPPKPRCEDKIYPMTLAEYESIMERLKKLEANK